MNAARRKEISRAIALLGEARAILEAAGADERAFFDTMPQAIQDGQRGERASEVSDALEEAASSIEDIETSVAEAALEVKP